MEEATNLLIGSFNECTNEYRNTPAARITPITPGADRPGSFGIARDDPFLVDDDAFDALDDEVVEELGV